jgi:hypothetical protein
VFFMAIHVPLTLGATHGQGWVGINLLYLAVVAVGIRLLIARVDAWSGGSLLVIGILHSSFNAAETVLEPGYACVRVVVTAAAGLGVAVLGRPGRTSV